VFAWPGARARTCSISGESHAGEVGGSVPAGTSRWHNPDPGDRGALDAVQFTHFGLPDTDWWLLPRPWVFGEPALRSVSLCGLPTCASMWPQAVSAPRDPVPTADLRPSAMSRPPRTATRRTSRRNWVGRSPVNA
jgi:hypothetical protein